MSTLELQKKLSLIEWLTQLHDASVLKKIDAIRKQSRIARPGMNISICRIEFKQRNDNTGVELQCAGANIPLYLIRNKILEEIKANKQPIGYVDKQEPFTNHSLQLNKGDTIIISSDGYADQFNPLGKKLKKRAVKEILLSVQNKSLYEQKKYLEKFHIDWKGDAKQTDDICMIGIRI